MAVLVTGASGFVGKILALDLAESGKTVHALVRSPEKMKDTQHPNIKLFKGDVTDPESLAKAAAGCTQAYHLAALADPSLNQEKPFFEINVRGTEYVLQACKDAGVEKVVFTSTAGVLGPVPTASSPPADEAHIREVDFFHPYESSKLVAEELVQREVRNGMNVVIVNITRVYGQGDMNFKNGYTMMLKHYMTRRFTFVLGTGKEVNNLVHMDDLVTGMKAAMLYGRAGERYILGSENISVLDIFSAARKLTGRRSRIFLIPIWMVRIVVRLDVMRTSLFGGKPAATPRFVRRYGYHWPFSVEKARQELGYDPINIEEGVRRTLAWMESEGFIPEQKAKK